MKIICVLTLVLGFGLFNAAAQNAPKPKIINAGVINGKAKSLPKPEYPATAQAAKASGAVKVQVTIDENGTVISAAAISGHPLLRSTAEQAARQAVFTPTTLSGQPVKVTGVIVYNFVAPEKRSDNEEKLLVMGLGVFVMIADFIPSEEWESFPAEDIKSVPYLSEELLPLTSINTTTTKEKRAEIIQKIKTSLEKKLTGTDAWQFELGKNFAEILLVLKNIETDTGKDFGESLIKPKLVKMKDSLSSAPSDFPPDVLEKLKILVEFTDVPNLNDDENKTRFGEAISSLLETISPGQLD